MGVDTNVWAELGILAGYGTVAIAVVGAIVVTFVIMSRSRKRTR